MTIIEKNIYDIKIKYQHDDVIVLEVEPINEDLVIVAYGDNRIPSLILQNQETREFTDIAFKQFKGFKIWAADLNDSLRVCLVRE
jgi:hypothetical protein